MLCAAEWSALAVARRGAGGEAKTRGEGAMERTFELAVCAGLGALSVLSGAAAFAQGELGRSERDMLDDLLACGDVSRERARLACFDGVLAAARDAGNRGDVVGDDSIAGTTTRGLTESTRSSERFVDSSPREPAAAPGEAAAAPAEATAAPARPSRDSAGAQRTEAGTGVVTIIEVNDQIPGEARFLTNTGQVIVQTSGGTPAGGYPEVPFDATLRSGALGSTFLYVSDRRRIRVALSE
jgi:hypothetical protein